MAEALIAALAKFVPVETDDGADDGTEDADEDAESRIDPWCDLGQAVVVRCRKIELVGLLGTFLWPACCLFVVDLVVTG